MALGQGDALFGVSMKHISLFILIFQNSALILTMRYSRILPGPRYLISTAVLLSEALKCLVSIVIHVQQHCSELGALRLPLLSEKNEGRFRTNFRQIVEDVYGPKSGLFKMFIPAILYTLQNNLQFVAASNLDAATFQVSYQCKILTTAVFAVTMLRQSISFRKWIALVLLTLGIACVQLPSSTPDVADGNWLLGISSVAVACICSGLAGVYFEKTLKKSNTTSLWVRNIQLSSASIVIAIAGGLVCDGSAIRDGGFFQGYNPLVAGTIVIQAGGGLIVAIVIKYADNVLKGFATSLSIIVSTIASVFLFDFIITGSFMFGSALVLLATYVYGMSDETTKVVPEKQSFPEPIRGQEDVEARVPLLEK